MRKRIGSLVGAILLLGTMGVGAASADPINVNSRYLHVVCNGEVLSLVTNMGSVAHVVGDSRVLVVYGISDHGQWLVPPNNGWDDKSGLLVCPYVEDFGGHEYVLFAKLSGN